MQYVEPCAFLVVLVVSLLVGVGLRLEHQLFLDAHDLQVQCLPYKNCGTFVVHWVHRATTAKQGVIQSGLEHSD